MLAQVFGGKVQVFFSIEILRSLAAMRTQVSNVLGGHPSPACAKRTGSASREADELLEP